MSGVACRGNDQFRCELSLALPNGGHSAWLRENLPLWALLLSVVAQHRVPRRGISGTPRVSAPVRISHALLPPWSSV